MQQAEIYVQQAAMDIYFMQRETCSRDRHIEHRDVRQQADMVI
jgi:hypothetical protein